MRKMFQTKSSKYENLQENLRLIDLVESFLTDVKISSALELRGGHTISDAFIEFSKKYCSK